MRHAALRIFSNAKWLLLAVLVLLWTTPRMQALTNNCYYGSCIDDEADDTEEEDDDCNPPASNDGPEGGKSPCPPEDSSEAGMAVWRVSEPYINLWIHDTPLRYRLANGRWLPLQLSYKQRSGTRATNYAGFGPNWECNWIGLLRKTNGSTVIRNLKPGGGSRLMQTNGTLLYKNASRVASCDGLICTVLEYPHLRRVYHDFAVNAPEDITVTNRFRTGSADRYGRTTQFHWTNSFVDTNLFQRLTKLTDRDGRACVVAYLNASFPSLVTSVTDPYGRSASFTYNEKGWLTNITDTAGMSSSFKYDQYGVITNLHTDYGDTGFRYFEETNSSAPLNRAIEITEPTGDKQLYTYRDDGDLTNSSTGGTFACDDGATAYRNSYHWDRRQYSLITAIGKTNYLNMPVEDYWKASLKHWLRQSATNTFLSDTPSAMAGPVVNSGVDDTRGAQVFLQYQGQTTPGYIGTLERITNIVWNGTSYSAGVSPAIEIGRNSWGRPTSITNRYNGATAAYTNAFDNDGRILKTVTGPRGEAVRGYGYHGTITSLLTSVTNALGEVLRYTHNTNGMKVTGITHFGGLVTTNLYYDTGDAEGFPRMSIETAFRTNQFTYTNGNLCIRTNELGLVTTNLWDNLNRLISVQFPDGTYTSNIWDKLDLAKQRDRMGFWTGYKYNAVRQLLAVTNANGGVTTYDYCGCGSPSTISRWEGSRWITTLFNYDIAGRLTNVIHPDGYAVSYTYDALERLSAAADSGGHQVEFGYNDYHQITSVKVGGGAGQRTWLSREFDEYGRLIRSVDRNGVNTTNNYDFLDRIVARRLVGADGTLSGLESFQYDSRGLTNYTDALAKVTWFVRDTLGRVLYQTNANQEVLGFGYNASDQLTALTDGKQQTTSWNYDAEGRATNKVDALNAEMLRYQYDPEGRLTNRWQAGGISTTLRYDPVGNLTNVDYPTAADIVLRYDALNRLTNLVDGIGSTAFTWTDGNQLASEDGPWVSDTVSFGYGARLRTSLSVQQPNASAWAQSYAYDPYWRLTNVTSPAGVFGTQYKSVTNGGVAMLPDLVLRLDLPGGSAITNTHDGLGRLLATVLQNSQLSTLNSHQYAYNSGHQRTKQTLTAGNYVDYSYDNIGQLKTAKGKEAGGATRWHEQFGYAYDAAWNLNYRTNNALVQAFGVDTLNELASATRSGNTTVAGTTTSPATNVTVNTVSALLYGDSTFALTNVSLTSGDNSFTAIAQDSYGRSDTNTVTAYLPATNTFYYDARGNLTNDGKRVFFYDDENQLTMVTVSNAWLSQFSYDGFMRRRIRKEHKCTGSAWSLTNEVRYVYDGRLVVQERDANNLALVSYTRGNDLSGSMQEAGGIGGLLARTDHSTLNSQLSTSPHAYYHADGNGNVTALVGTNGVMLARYHYDPYGTTLSASGPLAEANLYRFSSKEWHPNSGLIYYLYRYYDPVLQRWLNHDPLQEKGGLNLYGFVNNDSLNKADTDGQWIFIAVAIYFLYEAIANAPGPNDKASPPYADSPNPLQLGMYYVCPQMAVADAIDAVGEALRGDEGADTSEPTMAGTYVSPPRGEMPGFPDLQRARPKTPIPGGGGKLRSRWTDSKGNIYEWDYQEGHLEKYNPRTKHLGAFDPQTGRQIKPPKLGRTCVR